MTATGPMRLPVVLVPVAGDARDVVVECDPASTVADLARALVPSGGDPPLFHTRCGTWLAPELGVGAIGLRAGDTLVVGADPAPIAPGVAPTRVAALARRPLRRPAAAAAAAVEVAIVGGTGTGRRTEIGPGHHSVGRDPDAAITLSDPHVSRVHLFVDVSDDGDVAITPASPRAVLVDGTPIHARTALAGSEVVRIGSHALALEPIRPAPTTAGARPTADATGRIPFNRPPRPARPGPTPPIAVPAPPERPDRHHLAWGASLAPAIVGVVAWLITGSAVLLAFMALSPVIAIWTFVEDGRRGHRRFRTERRAYFARVDAATTRLATARAAEHRARRAAHPDVVALAARARNAAPDLWDRRPGDPDFLSLRLGTDDRAAEARANLADGGDPELRAVTATRLEPGAPLPDVPVAVELPTDGPLALSGAPADVAAATRALLLQIATHHSPNDVGIIAAVTPAHASEWRWLEWLPHTDTSTTPIAVGRAAGDVRVRALLATVDARVAEARAFGPGRAPDVPAVVAILDGDAFPDRAECGRLLVDGPEARVFVIWLAAAATDVPGACRTSVHLHRESGALHATWAAEQARADEVSAAFARQVATTLAGIRDVTAPHASGAVPRSVGLPDALDLPEPTAASIATRWQAEGPGLAAVIGAGAGGPVTVDLRHDGPHALVAGTTGSGKSELLRTLIVALAATHPPDRVNFLLVDYKGGAAFRECVDLPHSVGLVTDLDHRLARRVLTALDAEVKRRELLLHEARAKDLVELERRQPERAPASLVIVVDEFAALLRDVPEFVDGVVDIAQRGRSLGIHLVLATQRPSGVVSESVRANLNLRIALRVHDPDDSRDVVGSAEAATIPRSLPGRAFLRTGPGEIAEIQCAYAGHTVARSDQPTEPRAHSFPWRDQEEPDVARAESGATDLTQLVVAIRAAAVVLHAPTPVPPWLPPLPARVALDAIGFEPTEGHDRARTVGLGILDDPERQQQVPFVVDFEISGSLAIVGAGGSGATTALRTFAAALSPTDATVYAVDASGRGLDPLRALPRCGAVVAATDTDRVTALLAWLHDEIDARASAIADAGVGTFGELPARARTHLLPRIFLLLDGYGPFAEIYERIDLGDWLSMLHGIVADGRPVGIHVVLTAERVHSLPAALAASVPLRLLLRSADPDAALGLRHGEPGRLAGLPPGRAVLTDGREVQIAVADDGADAEHQRLRLEALGNEARSRGVETAPGVPLLPTHFDVAGLPGADAAPLVVAIAVADRSFTPRSVDLTNDSFLVVGPPGSGRTTALATIAWVLAHQLAPPEIVTVRPRHDLPGAIAALEAVLARTEGELPPPLVVLVDDGGLAIDGPIGACIERLLALGSTHPVRVVAAVDPARASSAFGGWVGELRRARRALLLSPDLEVDGDLVGARLRSRPGQRFPPGRGFLAIAGRAELVQVALPSDAEGSPRPSVTEAVGGSPPLPTASTADGASDTMRA